MDHFDTCDRNYLYGRLLCIMEEMEEFTPPRNTHYCRQYRGNYALRPNTTITRLMGLVISSRTQNTEIFRALHDKQTHIIANLFSPEEFMDDTKLNGLYIKGYDLQRYWDQLCNPIKAIRELRKMTQKELADKIGVSQTQISKWENEDSNPNYQSLYKLADALECDFTDLTTIKR